MSLTNEDLQAITNIVAGQITPMRESIENKIDSLGDRVDSLENKVDSLENKVDSLGDRVDSLESKMSSMELTIENEIRSSIKIIAEGHIDLTRKLDEALKIENEREMLFLRVNILENDVRTINEKIDIA